jgi:simple sugar transport system ATP-binding protein
MSAPLAVKLTGIDKYFGAVRANHQASLEVASEEIHAIVGENGAGKSTLMRILAGLTPADAGKIEVNGRDVTGWRTSDAIKAGVGMVHQHFMLVPTLTVAENVVLGREPRRGLAIDMPRAIAEVNKVAMRFGLQVDASRLVGELSVGEAQRVEILKTLFRGADLLILDEPTAVLSPPEVQDLWRVLRALRGGGGTIVLITHKLDEVMQVSDRITVMRRGETVGQMLTSATTPAEIAMAMVGREVALAGAASFVASATPAGASAALTVRDLVVAGTRRPREVDGVSFTVAPGEVLGIAGVEGNGQSALLDAIAGLRPAASGAVLLGDTDVTALSVRERGLLGLAHIPEDRHRRGLILDFSVADNLILGRQERFAHIAGLDREHIDRNARAAVERFDIRPADHSLPARALSGGNQQKIVIAREMGGEYRVLLAAQPTRGVDVGAIEFIHAQLRRARADGKAVLLVSAELQEILALADRVAVMYGGRIVGVMPRAQASEASLGPLMTGAGVSAA